MTSLKNPGQYFLCLTRRRAGFSPNTIDRFRICRFIQKRRARLVHRSDSMIQTFLRTFRLRVPPAYCTGKRIGLVLFPATGIIASRRYGTTFRPRITSFRRAPKHYVTDFMIAAFLKKSSVFYKNQPFCSISA